MGGPTYGEGGGGPLVGPKAQLFPKMRFEGSPYLIANVIKMVPTCNFAMLDLYLMFKPHVDENYNLKL